MAAMSYAKALNEAKAMILEQKKQITTDADTIKTQGQEIAQRKAYGEDLRRQLQAEAEKLKTLEAELTTETAAREQAEATCGRQRVQIEKMERRIGELDAEIADLKAVVVRQDDVLNQISQNLESTQAELDATRNELDATRAQLPTAEDMAALADMNAVLGHASVTMQIQQDDAAVDQAPVMAIYDDQAADAEPTKGGKKKNRSVFCFRAAA